MKQLFSTYQKLIGADNFTDSNIHVQVTGDRAAEIIRQKLAGDRPVMIGRFGATELTTILNYHFTRGNLFSQLSNIAKGIPYFSQFKKSLVHDMSVISGFFPATTPNLERFSELYFEDAAEIDVLGSWMAQEKYMFKYMNPNHVRVQLEDLSPFNHTHPWSRALEGKKVLVVHPFEDSIISQYKKRELLFKNEEVLPAFELKTIKAVQSYANNQTAYKDWFEALDHMTEQISNTDYDIAILGCGAYGLPLAARIKRMGKKSLHIGGAVQCIFGIKGKRWEIPFYNYQQKFYNEHWVRPMESEKPQQAAKVEGGTYW
jgi:hypothetical protein